MSLHSFSPEIAAQVGVNAAVIYQNFVFWCEKNKANRRHIRDGYVWTYNSRRAVAELFPYLTESQIKTAISKLIDSGLLVKGDYNLANYDKTNWYAPSVSAHWLNPPIGQKSPMDWSEIANGLAKNHQPIPDIKPDGKTDSKPLEPNGSLSLDMPCDVINSFYEFWDRYPRKVAKPRAEAAYKKSLKKYSHDDIMFGLSQHLPLFATKETQFIPHPTTWLNEERFNDQPEQPVNNTSQQPRGGASSQEWSNSIANEIADAARSR